MTEIMHHNVRDAGEFGGSVGNLENNKRSGDNSPRSNPRSLNSSHEGSPAAVNGQPAASLKNAAKLDLFKKSLSSTTLVPINDISPNHSQFFEVMYVGKIKVSHKRVPYTFIDDALPKFKAYDAMRLKKLRAAAELTRQEKLYENVGYFVCPPQYKNNLQIRFELVDENSTKSQDGSLENVSVASSIQSSERKGSSGSEDGRIHELKIVEQSDLDEEAKNFKDKILNTKLSDENSKPNVQQKRQLLRGQSQQAISAQKEDVISNDNQRQSQQLKQAPSPSEPSEGDLPTPVQRDRASSIGSIPTHDPNRTMVFLVGKSDIRLISPDKKQILLHKDFKEISTCVQGHKNPDHFGIICREDKTEGYIGYVFKCQSEDVANDIVAAISQSFNNLVLERKEKRNSYSCEHCPMLWYSRLLSEIDGFSDKKMQSTIFKRICQLSEEEQDIIMAKYDGAEEMADHNITEKNQFLMLMLKAHCESRQQRHVHDTAENRSEFLNQYLGGSTIFTKAKRSLSSSFDHLLKRKGSKDDFGHIGLVNEPIANTVQRKFNEEPRTNTNTPSGSRRNSDEGKENQVKSPMMDMFIKVGNNPKSEKDQVGSWRKELLNRVVSSNKEYDENESKLMSPFRLNSIKNSKPTKKRTKEELRELWRTAIKQIIILARMEKENIRLQEQHNENEIRKIKLDYDEIKICEKQSVDMWEIIINHEQRQTTKRDEKVLLQAIKNGVPRNKRGEVWMFLAEQHCLNTAPVDIKHFPNYNTPYNVLLKCLTEHQHAIFIDLGRTFPNHAYYKQSLGIGQLSLFNLLKAYSILDPELGYCQGLGFICGVLLLHLEEADAFQMLKHLMFRRKMRTKYLPDMKQFQLQLYQMSRLLKDYLPEVYNCFDEYDISPTLYAAPWILTVFSSQFPLGFVTRVFDYLFLESSEVIFKVALSILDIHKDEILKFQNFEEIMEYLKDVIPNVNPEHMEKIMREAFAMDISRQLMEYQVEYNVLQEEITTQTHHAETLNKVKEENLNLTAQLELAQTKLKEYEKIKHANQNQMQILHTQINGLEVTVDVLGQFISDLMDIRHDIEYPGEVRRIIQQINQNVQIKKPKSVDRKLGKSKSVNSLKGFPLRVLEELNETEKEQTVSKAIVKDKVIVRAIESPAVKMQNTLKSNSTAKLITKEEIRDLKKGLSFNEDLVHIIQDTSYNEYVKENEILKSHPSSESEKSYSISIPDYDAVGNVSKTPPIMSTEFNPLGMIMKNPPILPNEFEVNVPKSPEIDMYMKSLKASEYENYLIASKDQSTEMKTFPPSHYESVIVSPNEEEYKGEMHPLSNCGDINFHFKGTTQLKSIRPIHSRTSSSSSLRSLGDEFEKNGRS